MWQELEIVPGLRQAVASLLVDGTAVLLEPQANAGKQMLPPRQVRLPQMFWCSVLQKCMLTKRVSLFYGCASYTLAVYHHAADTKHAGQVTG
jgi:hypothetical protein